MLQTHGDARVTGRESNDHKVATLDGERIIQAKAQKQELKPLAGLEHRDWGWRQHCVVQAEVPGKARADLCGLVGHREFSFEVQENIGGF